MDLSNQILSAAWKTQTPYTAIVELTRRCNIHCVHCYATPERGRRELSTQEICRVLDELYALGGLFVTFSGGDVTVNRDYLRIMRHASDTGIAVQFFSNGLLIDDHAADELSKMNLFHVGISVYGATAEVHDRVTRHPGSFEKTVRAALRLRERGIYAIFKFIIMNVNVGEYEAMKQMADRLQVPYKLDVTITARDDLNIDTLQLRIHHDQMKKIFRDRFKEKFPKKPVMPDGSDLACTAARTLLSVNAYGDVFSCVNMPIPAGNVRYSPLAEIWNESPMMKALRTFPRIDRMHACPSCQLRAYCDRCPGNAFTETGDLYGPGPEACRQAMLWKEIENEMLGINEPVPPPIDFASAYRDTRCLPGWNLDELVQASGAGCVVS